MAHSMQAAVLATNIELKFEVISMPRLDILSESDPQVIAYNVEGGRKVELGRTEVARNVSTVKFVQGVRLQYFFERQQKLCFDVWDVDKKKKDDFIGGSTTTVGAIMASPGQCVVLPLSKNHGGRLLVRGEAMEQSNHKIEFTMAAKSLEKKDFLGKSDPFITVYRCNKDKSFSPIHKTEYVYQNLNPRWRPFTLTSQQLCNNNTSVPIRFEVADWDSNGSSDFIGLCEVTFEQLLDMSKHSETKSLDLINERKKKKRKYVNSGILMFQQVRAIPVYQFLDYVAGGMELHFAVAIDFTGSNGPPRDPASLHYQGNPGGRNPYTDAIRSVGEIIEPYDADHLFAAYGFGAKVGGQVMANFVLNGNPANPYCYRVDGLLQAYQSSINNPSVELWGPTNFAPVIRSVMSLAKAAVDGEKQEYQVLLIVTDGVISDMEDTKSALVEMSKYPVSVIIVGVGNADFSQMRALDADGTFLRSRTGNIAERDIVQFVNMNQFQNDPSALAAEVLREIPDQVSEYYGKRNIKPFPPRPPLPLSPNATAPTTGLQPYPSTGLPSLAPSNYGPTPFPEQLQSRSSQPVQPPLPHYAHPANSPAAQTPSPHYNQQPTPQHNQAWSPPGLPTGPLAHPANFPPSGNYTQPAGAYPETRQSATPSAMQHTASFDAIPAAHYHPPGAGQLHGCMTAGGRAGPPYPVAPRHYPETQPEAAYHPHSTALPPHLPNQGQGTGYGPSQPDQGYPPYR